MPKRTNTFQSFVSNIEGLLVSKGFKVTESKFLTDMMSNEQREVDVVIEGTVSGGVRVVIAVECIDRSRKATVEWIDLMRGKYEHLPATNVVLVSRFGFVRGAEQRAQKDPRFILATFEELTSGEWVKKFSVLFVEVITLGYAIKELSLIPKKYAGRPSLTSSITLDTSVFNEDGSSLGSGTKFGIQLLDETQFRAKAIELLKKHPEISTFDIEVSKTFHNGEYIFVDSVTKLLISRCEVKIQCHVQQHLVNIDHVFAYRNAHIAQGTAKEIGAGVIKEVEVTFVEEEGKLGMGLTIKV